MKIFTSRAFNQDVSEAKRAARIEPVFVTDRGRPTHVLLGIEAFRRLAGQNDSLVDRLAMADPIEDEPDWHAVGRWARPSDGPR